MNTFRINKNGAYITFEEHTKEIEISRPFEDEDEIIEEQCWLINNVFVPAEMRDQGIAKSLMTEAIEQMKGMHPEYKIGLWSEPQDEDTDWEMLNEFYEGFGFEKTGNGSEMVRG